MYNNPYLFEQAKKNMTPDNLRMASERLGTMSDDEIRNMSRMAGFNISPEMLKTSANMFKNMSPEEVERMKNMSAGMNYNQFNQPQNNNSSPPPNTSGNTTKPQYTKAKTTDPFETEDKQLPFPKIENYKKKGNDFFNKGQFEDASKSYLEAILEIEDTKMNEGKYDKEEIQRLEVACRLNYATTKAKLNEYEIVLTQAREVLKYGDNGKAFFRVGQALHHLGRNEKALQNLEQATKFLPDDPMVNSYLEKVQTALSDKDKENSIPNATEQQKPPSQPVFNEPQIKKPQENKDPYENNKQPEQPNKQPEQPNPQPPPEERKEKIKKKNVKLDSLKEENEKPNPAPKKEKKEVIIEEEKTAPVPPKATVSDPSLTRPASNNNPFANDPDKMNQAKKSAEQLKNMSPEQMGMMTDYFKNMDNGFLRQMMKQQSGVDMSDAELENIKNMMTPDMLKMMSGMNLDDMNLNMGNNNFTAPTQSGSTSVQTGNNPVAPTMPQNMNFGNLMQNTDMINGMMENMKKNPEMLKSMSKMLGENHPLSGMLNKSSPEDLQRMMNVMQVVVGFLGKIGKAIGWMRSNWKLVSFICVMMIIYYFFV